MTFLLTVWEVLVLRNVDNISEEHISDFFLPCKLKCGISVVCIALEQLFEHVSKILSLKLPLEASSLFPVAYILYQCRWDKYSIAF